MLPKKKKKNKKARTGFGDNERVMVLMGITAMVSAIVVDKEKAREVWVGG